jgi:dihydropyrimidinase
LTSSNAARIYNCYPRKGTIAVGSDADIVVWDPAATRTISARTHHQNGDFNVFEGMTVTGNAAVTLSRGAVLWQDGKLHATAGWGKYVPRPAFADFTQSLAVRNKLAQPTAVKRA